MTTQSLELPVTAQTDATPRVNYVGRRLGKPDVPVFRRREPLPAAFDHRVKQCVWNKPADLFVAMNVGTLEVVILRERRAVGYQRSRSVERAGLGDELHHVFVERLERQRV